MRGARSAAAKTRITTTPNQNHRPNFKGGVPCFDDDFLNHNPIVSSNPSETVPSVSADTIEPPATIRRNFGCFSGGSAIVLIQSERASGSHTFRSQIEQATPIPSKKIANTTAPRSLGIKRFNERFIQRFQDYDASLIRRCNAEITALLRRTEDESADTAQRFANATLTIIPPLTAPTLAFAVLLQPLLIALSIGLFREEIE